MTESQWLTCSRPIPMLGLVVDPYLDRKFRLLVAACCRRVRSGWPGDVEMQRAVDVAEAAADGNASEADRQASFHAVLEAMGVGPHVLIDGHQQFEVPDYQASPLLAAAALLMPENALLFDGDTGRLLAAGSHNFARILRQCKWAARSAASESPATSPSSGNFGARLVRSLAHARRVVFGSGPRELERGEVECAAQAALVRDVFGNPFRLSTLDPSWLTSTVLSLASSIYESRAFHDLPILADALEDAGCDNCDLLGHCRDGGIHARGCWALDLVLGKS